MNSPPNEPESERSGSDDPGETVIGPDELHAPYGSFVPIESQEGLVKSSSGTEGIPENARRIGRYVLQEVLGKGGFGTVYLAWDEALRRQVAVKAPRLDESDKSAEQAFLTEARQLARLRHPGIVGVLDVVSEAGACYIVSDFVQGVSLSMWLKQNQPDWKYAAHIALLLADALAHAHAHRTIHRDLKPANVIMTPSHVPVIVDFGLAVSDFSAEDIARGEIMGTPAYMSPEQAAGEGHRIDGRTDIYSLGVILYRMLTGRLPFDSQSRFEVLRQVREDEPQPLRQLVRHLPPELERICLKAMAKSLRRRYLTADDLAADLRTLLNADRDRSAALVQNPKGSVVSSTEWNASTVIWPENAAAEDDGSDISPVVGSFQKRPVPESTEPISSSAPSAHRESSRRRNLTLRRQVTIVSAGCDVFDSEDFQQALDADEQAAVLLAWQKFVRERVTESGGAFLQNTDTGIVACFGFPQVFEDSVLRAARFGLELQQLVVRFQVPGVRLPRRLAARVVMHTDLGVVESQARLEDTSVSSVTVIGNVRNYTARLESLAEFGTVAASEQTWRLLKRKFKTEPMGEHRVRGVATPVRLFQVTCEHDTQHRTSESTALTPLVGRDREMGLLQERWEQAVEGMGQIVLVIGEAGLGKSRLIHALRDHVVESSTAIEDPVVEWRASQQRQNSSFYPAIECFERMLSIEPDDTPTEAFEKLRQHLQRLGLDGNQELSLLASLLSIPVDDKLPGLQLTPQQQREQTSQLLLDWLRELASVHPVLFVIEDLHWVDPSTLEFVEQLVDQGLTDRILTLLTFRPEFETPWKSKAHQTNLALNRLTRRQIQELMELKAGRPLPAPLVEQIIERTEGVPLFVEEYTQMLVESEALGGDGDSSVSGFHAIRQIPSSLQDMLMSRLDRIDCDLMLVQLAATIGRTFSFALLQHVADIPETLLQAELDKLVAAELLFEQGRAPRHRYQFKHALLQDAAYSSLVKSGRQEFHSRIAEALIQTSPDVCEREPEVIAQHLQEGNQPHLAAEYWERAGSRSLHRYAYREAIQQLRAGLETIRLAPESRERHLREIELHVMLGVPLQSIVGYSAPEVEENYARAFALCRELKLNSELFPILYGLFRYYMLQGKYLKACEIGQQLVSMAEQNPVADFLVAAHRAVASPLVYQGEYSRAMPHLETVLSIPATDEIRARLRRYDVVDPFIAAGSYRAWALWLTGYPDQALQQAQQTLAEAEALRHPFTIALALSFSTWLHQFRRDIPATLETASRAIALSEEHGFRFWIGWGNVLRHWALGVTGQNPSAFEAIRQGIVMWRAQGSELGASYFFALQAEAALATRNTSDAAIALSLADDFAKTTTEGFPVPELHRLRGETLSMLGKTEEADQQYRLAISEAVRQNARSWHLRAAVSLCRLHAGTARGKDAVRDLKEVYGQFTEGHATADLREAAAVLREHGEN